MTIDRTNPSCGKYKIRFTLGENHITHYYNEGDPITPPDAIPSHFTISEGERFVAWDMQTDSCNGDTTIAAITTKYFDPEYFLAAYTFDLLVYPSDTALKDNAAKTLEKALALTCLLIEENQNPKSGAVAKRIAEHLTAVAQEGRAPAFDARCFWSYAPHAGSIAMAKMTPSVWKLISADVKARLDTMMRAFAILESFATSDYNNYSTGPGMFGNYNKSWNPNYRLANVPVIVYATHYFGNGDMALGAEYVNAFLKGFDEDAYESIVNTFQKYGWHRAFQIWTTEALMTTDGTNIQGKSAKDLLLHGGQAVGKALPVASEVKVALGKGVGVPNNGQDYIYNGYGLNESDGIIRSLLMHNYGTNDLTKSNPKKSTFLEVKSDHWYDIKKNGTKERIAWIVDESESPYQGRFGMMKEFASGNRSSTAYCSHDFLLTTSMLSTCKILGIYDATADDYTDTNGVSIREAIVVGNEDFLYKNETGYLCFATGSYGTSTKEHSEKNEHPECYFVLKSLWRNVILPELNASLQ